MLSKLDGFDSRFEEVSTLITDPDVISDRQRYVKLTKEYRWLRKLLDAANEYRSLLSEAEEAKTILAEDNDEEMRAMAREIINASQTKIPEMEENIKFLLIPSDPEDAKNAVVEIRGGTGGDEAALFAGDLSECIKNLPNKKVGNWK